MKLLLHACCADCLIKFLDSVEKSGDSFEEIMVYFYNPNIQPRSEYLLRLRESKKLVEERNIKLVVADWSPKEYFKALKSKKKGKRCVDCWQLRLEKTVKEADKEGFKLVSSTLINSQYQNREKIKEIGEGLSKEYKVNFYWPKELSQIKTKGFYKQNYCGCCYSLVERSEEKFN